MRAFLGVMNGLVEILILASFGLFGGALTIGSWLPRRRGLADWLMGIGSTLGAISFGIFGVAISLNFTSPTYRMLLQSSLGGIGIGAIIFSMGFLMHRASQRNQEGTTGPDVRHWPQQ
jgi:hypothetical protein